MISDDKVGSLEEEALKRKDRLKALKRKLETGGSEGAKIKPSGDAIPK